MEILKRLFTFGLMLLVICSTKGMAQTTSFYKVFSGNGYDRGYGAAQLLDSSYLVTGTSSSFAEAPSQAFLLKLDKYGEFQWSKAYGGPEFEEGNKVLTVDGYGYYLLGNSSSGSSANFDVYIVFTDESGNLSWEKRIDFGAWEHVNDALLLPDTSMIIVGETDATTDGNTDALLMRISKDGTIIWSNQLENNGSDNARAICKLTDTTFVVAGSTYLSDSLQNKGFVASYHVNGTQLWDTVLGSNGNYWLNDILVAGTELKVIGEQMLTGKTDFDYYRASIGFNGAILFQEGYYNAINTRYSQFVMYSAAPGNQYFVGAQIIDPTYTYPDGEDLIVSRYNSNFYYDGYGESYSNVGQDQLNHMIPTLDGYALLVGYHTSIGSGGNAVMVVKIGDPTHFPSFGGNSSIENIVTIHENLPLEGAQVYPNPIRDELHLLVANELFDYRVTSLAGTIISQGSTWNSVQLDTNDWPAGVYMISLLSGKGSTCFKVIR
jgi:hypothetical protein